MQHSKSRQQGFSLIEIIVVIVVAGFLGAVVVNLMGTQLVKSGYPLISTKEAATAEAALENVVAYYTGQVNDNATFAAALDNVKANYNGNATVGITDTLSWNSVRALTVTVTVGQSRFTTLLTHERSNVADNAVTY